MTALLATPDLAGPRPGCAAALNSFLDDFVLDLAGLDAAGFAVEVSGFERALRRVQALKLQVLAHARTTGVAKATGMSGTEAWLARATKTDRRDASGQVRLSAALDEHLPATAAALGKGTLSADHAKIIADAAAKLPDHVTPAERTVIEEALVGKAKVMTPRDLRRAARRSLEAITPDETVADAQENDELVDEETQARARAELTMWDNADGTVSGRFTVPHLPGAILRAALEQMTSPRRAGLGAAKAQTGPVWFDRDAIAHRNGLAFAELLEHLPTDRLHHNVAATVVVKIDQEKLANQMAAAGLDTGEKISAGEARRIACNAGILPVVLDGRSRVLDVGTTQRLFNDAQRIALGLHYDTCAADGCERPFAWCEIHHRIGWAQGGPTNLGNAVPLCNFHHQRIHDPKYDHKSQPSGAITFHARR